MKRCAVISRTIMSLVLFVALATTGYAQASLGLYDFQHDGGPVQAAPAPLTGGQFANTVGANFNVYSPILPIEFPGGFWFNGINYTHLRISSNGWVALGRNAGDFATLPANAVPTNTILQNSSISIVNPIIAPLWDNFASITGGVSWESSATSFRVLWRNVNWEGAAGVSFELELRAVGNAIRFRYYSGGNNTAQQSAVIGIIGEQATPRQVRLLTATNPLAFTGDRQNNAAYAINRTAVSAFANDAIIASHYPALIVTSPATPTLNLGNVTAPAGTASATFSLLNIGGTPVNVDNSTFALSGSDRFTLPTFNHTIAPSATQNVTVNFAATCPVVTNGTATLTTAGGFATTIVYPNSATGLNLTATELSARLTAINISNAGFAQGVTIGQTTTATLTIQNSGTGAYSGPVTLSASLTAAGFTVAPANVNIPAGGTANVTLTFAPTVASHNAAANATTWVANYTGTIEGSANPCGAVNPSLTINASSNAPRLLVNNPTAPNVQIARLLYGPAPGVLAVGTMNRASGTETLEFRNTGSSPVTISDAEITGGVLQDRFTAELPTGVTLPATLAPGASVQVTVRYTPNPTTNDFPWTAEATGQNTVAADVAASAQWQFTTQPAGITWVNATGAQFANAGQVITSINVGRGLLRAVLANQTDNSIAPTLRPNGQVSVDGGASTAIEVNNSTNRITVQSAWGEPGDILPGGGVILNAPTSRGSNAFWIVNNGNAVARFYVPELPAGGAFSLSPQANNPGTGEPATTVLIDGVSYTLFNLEPAAVDPARSRARVTVNFNPTQSNVANPFQQPNVQTEFNILTDANIGTSADASVGLLASYAVGLTGQIIYPDPIALVYTNDAATADRTIDVTEVLNFGRHELGNVASSTFPFLGGGPTVYNAPSEVLARIFNNPVTGYASAFARAKALYGMGVRDTVITLRLRNRGTQAMTFNSAADVVANAVAIGGVPSPGTFSGVFIAERTGAFAGYPSGFTAGTAPVSNVNFPFVLQPGNGNELIVWVRYDAGNRVTGSLFNGGVSNGEFRATSAPAAENIAQVRYSFALQGTAIRPFPVTSDMDINNAGSLIDPAYSIDNPRTVAELTSNPVKLDNWCGTVSAQNRDSDTIVLSFGNGFPLPTDWGNVNDDAVSPWTFTLTPAAFSIIDVRDNADGIDSIAYGENAPSFTIVTDEDAEIVFQDGNAVVATAAWGSEVTLQPGQVLRVKVVYRPVDVVEPGVETALVRFTQHANRNNNIQFPAETGASHTGILSDEKGDVFRHLDYVVNGITARAALRVELAENGDFVMPGGLGAGIDFNLPYPYTPGVFVGDSNFVNVNLVASASNSQNVTPAEQAYDDIFVSGIGIKSIEIIGEDAEDFEIVGFNLPAGVNEPHPVVYGFEDPAYSPFPISVPTGLNSLKVSKLQWTLDLGNGIQIGRPFTLDRNPNTDDPESAVLAIHFRPRQLRDMATGNLHLNVRRAAIRIETDEPCIGTDGIFLVNLTGRPLSADVRVIAGTTNAEETEVNFGVVQVNDVAEQEITIRNFGNYPAHFINRFQSTANNIVPIDIPFQKFLNFSNRNFYMNNFSTIPLGYRIDQGNSRAFDFIGDTISVLNPNQERAIVLTYAPLSRGRRDAGFTMSYIPNVMQRLEGDNVVALLLRGQAADGSILVVSGERVNADTIDFGNVAVGGFATTIVRVRNSGDADIDVTLPSNMFGSPFSHTPDNITVTIPARQTVEVEFRFAPTVLGAANGIIEIDGVNAFGSPMTVRLFVRGTGVVPVAVAPAAGLNFGVTRVFSDSTLTATVENLIDEPVFFDNFRIIGADGNSFALVANDASAMPNSVAAFNVRFSPTTMPANPGDLVPATNATLVMDANFVVNGQTITSVVEIPLRGNGGIPQIAFEETEDGDPNDGVINFRGGVTSRRFTIRNVGRFPLEVTQVQIVGTNADKFALANVPQQRVLAFEQSFESVVNYIGNSTDIDSARIVAISNTQQQRSLDLAGTAAAARLSLSSSNVNFGNVAVNTVVNRTLTITNTSGAPVRLNQVSFTNAANNDYVVTGKSKALPAELANGETFTMTISFEPRTVGDKSQRLLINSDVEQTEVSLFGRAINASLSMAQSLNFGNVVVGSTRTLKLSIRNSGTADIEVERIAVEGENAAMFAMENTNGFVVLAGETREVNVNFTPNSRGMKNAIAIVTPEAGSPLQAVLFGNGGAAALSVAQTLNFGDTQVDNAIEQDLTVSNTGDADLVINETTVSGLHNADFTVVSATPVSVAPGQSTTIRVRFAPRNQGSRTAVLSINSNIGSPVTVELRGSATPTSINEGVAGFALTITDVAPNPVRESATVRFTLDQVRQVSLKLYNSAGAEVATLVAGSTLQQGDHVVRLNATTLASGAYYLRLEAGETVVTKNVTIVK